jgi:hypothetical protein
LSKNRFVRAVCFIDACVCPRCVEQDVSRCKHYSCIPGVEVTCALGIDIREHVGGDDYRWRTRMPCMTSLLSCDQEPCDKREIMSTADWERRLLSKGKAS